MGKGKLALELNEMSGTSGIAHAKACNRYNAQIQYFVLQYLGSTASKLPNSCPYPTIPIKGVLWG